MKVLITPYDDGFAREGEYRLVKGGDEYFLGADHRPKEIISGQDKNYPMIILTEINKPYKAIVRGLPISDCWVYQYPNGETACCPINGTVNGPMLADDGSTWRNIPGEKNLQPLLDFYGISVPRVDDWQTSRIKIPKVVNMFDMFAPLFPKQG